MEEQKKKSFEFVNELTKQLIALPTLVIGIMISLQGKTASDAGIKQYFWPWLFFFLSIVFGLAVFMKLTGVLANSEGNNVTVYKARWLTIGQICSFSIGMFWLIILATH